MKGGHAEWSDSICVEEDEMADGRLCFELREFEARGSNSSFTTAGDTAVDRDVGDGAPSSAVLHEGCMTLPAIVTPGNYEVALGPVGEKVGSEAKAGLEP
jgi:hypothetical protein